MPRSSWLAAASKFSAQSQAPSAFAAVILCGMAVAQQPRTGNSRLVDRWLAPLLVGILLMGSAPWWWEPVFGTEHSTPTEVSGTEAEAIVGFVGSCEPFRVVAQNRYNPPGARKLKAPDVLSTQVGSFGPNELIAVDGWVHGAVAYPTNSPPFNSDIWFHLADDSGWVAFAAVRANPTVLDPTGLDPDGGTPAATPSACEGAIQ